jgi:hypothetical protein
MMTPTAYATCPHPVQQAEAGPAADLSVDLLTTGDNYSTEMGPEAAR